MANENSTSSKRKRTAEDDGAVQGVPGPKRAEFSECDFSKTVEIKQGTGQMEVFTVPKDLIIRNSGLVRAELEKGIHSVTVNKFGPSVKVYLGWLYDCVTSIPLGVSEAWKIDISSEDVFNLKMAWLWCCGEWFKDPGFQDAVMLSILNRGTTVAAETVKRLCNIKIPSSSKLWLWLVDAVAATMKVDEVQPSLDKWPRDFSVAVVQKLINARNSKEKLKMPAVEDFEIYRVCEG